MQPSLFRTPRLWRFLFFTLVASFTFLILFTPITAIYAGLDTTFNHVESQLNSRLQLGLPVALKNLPASMSRPGILLITEVLYNPSGSEPGGEWFELYNAGDRPIELTGYKVGDQTLPGCCEGMLAFPPGSVLKPGEVIIIANQARVFEGVYGFKPDYEMENSDPTVPVLTRYTAWAERAVELTNTGDDLLILGPSDQIIDAVSWGSSTFAFDPPVPIVQEGYSLERYPPSTDSDTAQDWRKQSLPKPGQVDLSLPTATPSPIPSPTVAPLVTASVTPSLTPTLVPTPFGGKLLLSEFLYNPFEKEPDGEWIEIYNASTTAVSLQDFKLGDEEKAADGEGMLRFPEGSRFEAGQAIVVAHHAAAFFTKYGYLPDYELFDSLSEVPDLLVYTDWGTSSLSLHNEGDELLILDGLDQVIEALSYGDSSIFFSPSIPLSTEGCSLERYPGNQDTNSASDWREQCEPSPGRIALPVTPTPTAVPKLVINEIHHAPDPEYGDANNDGVAHLAEDEFVEIVNLTGVPVNLEGWCLSDGLACRHLFPSPSWIPHECSVVIFGYGEPDGSFGGSLVQVSSTHALSLNDVGDSLTLTDASGISILSLTYASEGVTGESLTRYPDINGEDLIPHTLAPEASGERYSPGTYIDGSPFPGCSNSD
jgi:hypothetical protein